MTTLVEPRWPVAMAAGIVVSVMAWLPGRIRVFPAWVPVLAAIILIVPMAVLVVPGAKPRWLRIERIITLGFVAIAGLGMVASLRYLLIAMVRHSNEITGLQLLTSSVAVWATNVLIFALAYWRTDRGGPEARVNHVSKKPDWLFPQESVPEHVPHDWHPTFIDYLFLSYCTATAFSPAEAQPLTSRGMLLLMFESIISLVTVIVVASRAINILGT